MNYPLSNEALKAMAIPAEEQVYQASVDQLTDQISRCVIIAAKKGLTKVANISVLLPDIPTAMILRQVGKRFPEARVGYERKEDSEMKLVYVDWT
jgi:hypothetical protein